MKSYYIIILYLALQAWLPESVSAHNSSEAYSQQPGYSQRSNEELFASAEYIDPSLFYESTTVTRAYDIEMYPEDKKVCYKFNVWQASTIVIDHAGSIPHDTAIQVFFQPEFLYDAEIQQLYYADNSSMGASTRHLWETMPQSRTIESEIAVLHEEQAFLCIDMKQQGYCYVICSVPHPEVRRGTIRTNIHYHPRGWSLRDPIDFGSIESDYAYYSRTSYMSNSGFGMHYLFKLPQKGVLNVSNKSDRGTLTSLTLYRYLDHHSDDPHGESVVFDSGDNYPRIDNFYPQIVEKELPAGRYMLLSEGGSGLGVMTNSIKITTRNQLGDSMDNPIFIGSYIDDFSYSHDFNTQLFSDTFGSEFADVVHSFELCEPMDVTISAASIDRNFPARPIECYLLNQERRIIHQAVLWTKNPSLECTDLPAGLYYVIVEGARWDGFMCLWIHGNFDESRIDHRYDYTPTADYNYIQTITPSKALSSQRLAMNPDLASHTISYYDHMGRPVQVNMRSATPDYGDLIQRSDYNLMGNIAQKWLPVPHASSGEYLPAESYTGQSELFYGDTYAYSETIDDRSPFSRPAHSFGPGTPWRDAMRSTDNTYLRNHEPVLRYVVTGSRETPVLSLGSVYPENALDVVITQNEDEQVVRELTDKRGNKVFVIQETDSVDLSTAYVYDAYGNVCFVLPPMFTQAGTNISQQLLNDYAYQYCYDSYNRCIAKKLPGIDWCYYGYDKAGKQILSQDGEQRIRGEWTVSIPDILGRQVICAKYTNPLDCRSIFENHNIYASFSNTASNTFYGYKLQGFLPNMLKLFSVNYYDTYDFIDLQPTTIAEELNYVEDNDFGAIRRLSDLPYAFKGLLTGSILTDLSNAAHHYKVFYYDEYKRPVQVRETNALGRRLINKYKYDFSGTVLSVQEQARPAAGIAEDVLTTHYTYDHQGRLLSDRTTLNDSDPVTVNYSYDELGRLSGKSFRAAGESELVSMDRIPVGTNIRGWTFKITGTDLHPSLAEEAIHRLYINGTAFVSFEHLQGEQVIVRLNRFVMFTEDKVWNIYNGGWTNSGFEGRTFTIMDDQDYIVTANELPAGDNSAWGFDRITKVSQYETISMDQIPVGRNIRGWKFKVSGTDLDPGLSENAYFRLYLNGTAFMNLRPDGKGNAEIECNTGVMVTEDRIWGIYKNKAWIGTEGRTFTIKDDQDYIVTENQLPAGTNGRWGFDRIVKVGEQSVTMDNIPAGTNIRGWTFKITRMDLAPVLAGDVYYKLHLNDTPFMNFEHFENADDIVRCNSYVKVTEEDIWDLFRGRWKVGEDYIFTIKDDQDYIVTRNDLFPGNNANWGLDRITKVVPEPQGITETYSYNIRGWQTDHTVKQAGEPLYRSQLRYTNPRHNRRTPYYSGNIAEWEWQHAGADLNTYVYEYDNLSRLQFGIQFVNNIRKDDHEEKGLTYDANGNIRSLYRTNYSLAHIHDYTYTGNQLTSLDVSIRGTDTYTYDYDANGNMTRDGANDLDITYNHLNLIQKVELPDGDIVNYSYLSDGTKLSALSDEGYGYIYMGSLVYMKVEDQLFVQEARFSGGQLLNTVNNQFTPLYHIKDHLGSVRTVINGENGDVLEQNDYYPFGMRVEVQSAPITFNRFRYNGKEEQHLFGIPYIDYGARMYDPKYRLGWNAVDPLAEMYYPFSPYAFCLNNPVRFMDTDGRRVSIANLSSTHRQSLQTFMNSKTGRAFIGRYMGAGESLTVNGQTYTFKQAGDRAKDLLSLRTSKNLRTGLNGVNETRIKGSMGRQVNEASTSEVDKIIKIGVQQTITLNDELGAKEAVGTLGHEAFVHADKDADALTELDNTHSTMTPSERLEALTNIGSSGDTDHRALGNGLVTKFKQFMTEITINTGDNYYVREYQRQVKDYKNR